MGNEFSVTRSCWVRMTHHQIYLVKRCNKWLCSGHPELPAIVFLIEEQVWQLPAEEGWGLCRIKLICLWLYLIRMSSKGLWALCFFLSSTCLDQPKLTYCRIHLPTSIVKLMLKASDFWKKFKYCSPCSLPSLSNSALLPSLVFPIPSIITTMSSQPVALRIKVGN